ncbi:ferredoxin [Streptomyces sp. NBC_01602]
MKIALDRPRCAGRGLCEEAAPQLMHLDDDGELVLDREQVDEADAALANAAVRACPVAARRGAAEVAVVRAAGRRRKDPTRSEWGLPCSSEAESLAKTDDNAAHVRAGPR